MSQLFLGEEREFISLYLDGVLTVSQSMEEDIQHIEKLPLHLREARLQWKPSKCTFVTDEIEYLGNTLCPMV